MRRPQQPPPPGPRAELHKGQQVAGQTQGNPRTRQLGELASGTELHSPEDLNKPQGPSHQNIQDAHNYLACGKRGKSAERSNDHSV